MTTVVISQPMFFPWVGLFEQIRLADVYVHYDDAQFSKGGFSNRVQLKTSSGSRWLTVPLLDLHLGQAINQVRLQAKKDWQPGHVALIEQAYRRAPYCDAMLGLVQEVYAPEASSLADLATRSIDVVCQYLGMATRKVFLSSSSLNIAGASSQRVLDIVKSVGGDTYVTGHGAQGYLDHELFENAGVEVRYLAYRKTPYPQLHGEFTPYVSVLDLIANVGTEGVNWIHSPSVNWKEFLAWTK
ncbi:MAG: WbqC family protein [Pseudomonadota bacterium]|jgi:hypothetical protein